VHFAASAALALYGLLHYTDTNLRARVVSLLMAVVLPEQLHLSGQSLPQRHRQCTLLAGVGPVGGLGLVPPVYSTKRCVPAVLRGRSGLIALPILLAYIISLRAIPSWTYFALTAFYGLLPDGLLDVSWGIALPFCANGASGRPVWVATWLKINCQCSVLQRRAGPNSVGFAPAGHGSGKLLWCAS